jgi:hypothetical protein
MPEDVDTAVELLMSQAGVDHQVIGLAGASAPFATSILIRRLYPLPGDVKKSREIRWNFIDQFLIRCNGEQARARLRPSRNS